MILHKRNPFTPNYQTSDLWILASKCKYRSLQELRIKPKEFSYISGKWRQPSFLYCTPFVLHLFPGERNATSGILPIRYGESL